MTLQIPAANLTPSRISAGSSTVCEPVIVAKRLGMTDGGVHMSVEQLENKLLEMRDAYNEHRLRGSSPANEAEASVRAESDEREEQEPQCNTTADTYFNSQVSLCQLFATLLIVRVI